MAAATIPVDLRNPGQVFACLGFMEAAELLCGRSEGAFGYVGSETLTTFRLSTLDSTNPVEEVLSFLRTARVVASSPLHAEHAEMLSAERWGVATVEASSASYPFEPPRTPATLAAMLIDERKRKIPITHWGDSPKWGRDNVKFWAGSGGYPGAALARDALDLFQRAVAQPVTAIAKDPFAVSVPQSSSFRFDWRRDYVPLDVGFSPNEHGNVLMVGFPIVELLAAVGLEHARPERPKPRDPEERGGRAEPERKLTYRYGVSNANLPIVFVRAVLGAQGLNFPMRIFRIRLGWPGQEGQARCIVDAREENVT